MEKIGSRNKGIILIIISAFGFAMMSAFVKLAGDLPSFQKTFFRNLVSCFVAMFFIIKHKQSFFGKKENQKILITRSTFGTLGIIFNFYAIDKLVLSDANMLNKLSPFLVIIFSALFLKEKINLRQLISIIIAFIGALFIIRPEFNMAVMPAIVGVLGAAYTCLRFLGGKEKHYTIVFYFSTFSLIVIAPFMIAVYKPMSFMQFVYLIFAGIFATVGQFGITLAYKYAPSKEISIFDYSNIIFSAIISFVVFGVLPDYMSIIGYVIIFGASLYMYLYNRKLDKEKA